MFLEELIQEQASFLCPFGLHLTVRAAVTVLEVEGLAMGIAFSLILGVQESLRPHPVDDPEFMEFLVQCLRAHPISLAIAVVGTVPLLERMRSV